jgi:hypothetical protein
MKAHVREIKKEIQQLMDDGEIEDFELDQNRRHFLVRFRVKNTWLAVPFASSPRTPYASNFTKQQIRRRIRSLS